MELAKELIISLMYCVHNIIGKMIRISLICTTLTITYLDFQHFN